MKSIFKPSATFDAVRFSSSWLISPKTLFWLRTLISSYIFCSIFVKLGIEGSTSGELLEHDFSYFTSLTFWGLAFYFAFAALHTGSYVFTRSHVPFLSRWPAFLQTLHSVFYSTIVVFPFLVTIVYWALLAPSSFPSTYSLWSNVTQHALNSVFAVIEIVIPRTNPLPFLHLIAIVVILGAYLGLAYVAYSTEHFYVYDFLDDRKHSKGVVAGYIVGILVAGVILFLIVKGLIHLRIWVTEKKLRKTGKVYNDQVRYGRVDEEMGKVKGANSNGFVRTRQVV